MNFQFSMFNFQSRQAYTAGFTLLEMTIAIGIFLVVVITAIGLTLGMMNARLKAGNLQDVQDNIRFVLELLTKELRTGTQYQLTTNCVLTKGQEISFLSTNSLPSVPPYRVYYLDASTGTIMRATLSSPPPSGCGTDAGFLPFTAENIKVTALTFALHGAEAAPGQRDGQPWVTISLRLQSAEPQLGAETAMSVQTSIARRLRDIECTPYPACLGG